MSPQLTWKPHRKQQDFCSLPDSIFEGLYGGAAGGGKSDALVMLPVIREFHKEPRFKGIIFRRTYPELESEIILRSKNWYPHFGGTYQEGNRRWIFPSKAIIQFGHMDHENDVRKYDTAEYQYAAFDELTSFAQFQYKYFVHSRMRVAGNSNLPVIVRSATNPGNIGHAWVRDYFVKPAPPGTLIKSKVTGQSRIFIQALATDNPHIDQNYVSRMLGLPEAERRAKLEGDWYTFEGQVFSDFRENHFPGEPDNALHVIEPFRIPEWWHHLLAIDWGYTAFTVGLWGAISPNGRLYLYKEYAKKNQRVSEWSSEIGELSQGIQFKSVVLCRSAWQNRGEDNLVIADKFRNYAGFTAEPAKDDRIQGKIILQELLRWTPKPASRAVKDKYDPEIANRILRTEGTRSYDLYLKSFVPEGPEDNLPKLQILKETCPGLVNAIPLCIYGKPDSRGKPSEDVKEFDGDDFYDCLRYLACEADELLGDLRMEGEKRLTLDQAITNLERTGNQTAYYREMEKLEAAGTNQFDARPVSRFHRGRV